MTNTSASKEDQYIFLDNLRTQTSVSHRQLEENELSGRILLTNVDLAHYQAYISRMYGVVAGCEKTVFPVLLSVFPDLQKREKSMLIVNDLKITGLADMGLRQLPVCNFTFSTIAEALGIMYVLEGSTLGGKVLYKNIHKSLGLDSTSGASFFWGYGTETGNMWKGFISRFSDYVITNNCEQEVISSAIQTFKTIDEWLSQSSLIPDETLYNTTK
jgi:heme oxygenase